MSKPEELIEQLAELVSDDQQVEWEAVSNSADVEEKRWISNLRVLSDVRQVARLERSPHAAQVTEEIASSPQDDSAGESLTSWGPLQILERLGGGGFGDVFRAWDTRLHRQVALKLLHRQSEADDGRSLEEARLLARVEHPNVVRIYGAETQDGRTGIWMELVMGLTLNDLVNERGAMPAFEAARIGIELCGALAAVHAANIVHQDIKPKNVMCESATGRIVLMDFGAGRRRQTGASRGALTGTPQFMAPEILQGAPPAPQSDVYAVGALLRFLLAGQPPSQGSGFARRPEGPPALEASIERAMAPERTHRYTTVSEMQAELEAALPALSVKPPGENVAQPPASPGMQLAERVAPIARAPHRAMPEFPANAPVAKRRRSSAVLVAAALLLALGGAAVWRFARPNSGVVRADVQFVEARSNKTLQSGDSIGPQDQLEIVIEPSRTAYVYVLNVDNSQNATVMFPMTGGGPSNPLAAGTPHHLPGTLGATHLGWTFSSDPGLERFLVIVSPTRLEEFETELSKLPIVALGGGLTVRPLPEETASVLTRSVTGVAPIPVPPSAQPKGLDALLDLARSAGNEPSKSRVWLQEMRLLNRGG